MFISNRKKALLISIISVFIFFSLWEFVSRSNLINQKLFPPPSNVFTALLTLTTTGELRSDVVASINRAVAGFLLGSLLGILLGIVTGRLRIFDYLLSPTLQLLRPIPIIALVPLAIIWFGLGETSKIFLVLWGVFFPVWINTYLGVSRVEKTFLWAARNLGANRLQLWLHVILPAAAPSIIAGLRTSISLAFIVLVAAEMSGAFHGVGYRITAYHLVFEVDKMIANIAVLGLLGFLSDRGFAMVVNRLFPWYRISITQE